MDADSRIFATILLVAHALPSWAQHPTNIQQASRIAAAHLESPKVGYSCKEIGSPRDADPALQQAIHDAQSRGDHVLHCSAFSKPAKGNEGLIGMRDGGLIVFVSKLGEIRQPYWKY